MLGRPGLVFESDDQRFWLERASARGLTVPTWPQEYGGAGLDPQRARIFEQELARLHGRRPLDNHGIWMLGPALLEFGTDEQKREHLSRIARGEIRWCQGYSEPGAGSDLANVQTRGVEDGSDFIVNGSKLWTSYAAECDWIFALVRTEPNAGKHAGISFVLIDMADPGVTVRRISLLSGEDHFCQTYFDDVRVPQRNVVCGRGGGWAVTRYLLNHERAMMGERTHNSLGAETLSAHAMRVAGGAALTAEPKLREDVVDVELDGWAFNIWLERIGDQAKAGQMPEAASSALKVFGTELAKRRAEVVLALNGSDGLAVGAAPSQGWLSWPAGTIGGGTTEIQLNIIAKRALGLPER